jgi:hypothetical protein
MLLPQQLTINSFRQDLTRYNEAENICVRVMGLINSQRPTPQSFGETKDSISKAEERVDLLSYL